VPVSREDDLRELYLRLLKLSLTGMLNEDPPAPIPWLPGYKGYNRQMRAQGSDWPSTAPTMIGLHRLQNIQDCVEAALEEGIPGDLMETGVWRGGSVILMRALLEAHGDKERLVWAADSFQGLLRHAPGHDILAVPEEEVRRNFERYGMLDDRVRFIPGWFHESMPLAPVRQLAVLRLDGDQYAAQMPVLEAMEPKVSPGGFIIVDDYPGIEETRQAVDEYRERQGITQLVHLDVPGAGWWRK
jgi:Macrocin-O-methyltransferase (TylF)